VSATSQCGGSRIIASAPKDDAAFLPAAELASGYRSKELSLVEVVRAVLDRIVRHDGAVNAYCWVDREGALGSAREADAF